MPTIIQRTQAHYQLLRGNPAPSTKAREKTTQQTWPMGGRSLDGRRTPPREGSPDHSVDEPVDLDATPSARAKVLPWVEAIKKESYASPEGMHGPYASEPSTRPQTEMFPASTHPFAHPSEAPHPTDSIISAGGELRRSHDHKREHRAESNAISRGVAPPPTHPVAPSPFFSVPTSGYPMMPGLPIGMMVAPAATKFQADPSGPAMETFGKEHVEQWEDTATTKSNAPVKAKAGSKVPSKPSAHRSKAQSRAAKDHFDLPPKAPTAAKPPTVNEHHAHPDHPFTHIAMAISQARAQDRARALHEEVDMGSASSEPSFGHDMFAFIPPPPDVMAPRPVIVMRNSGAGLGLGFALGGIGGVNNGLNPSIKGPFGDRSAYVETIDDEETLATRPMTERTGRPDSEIQPAELQARSPSIIEGPPTARTPATDKIWQQHSCPVQAPMAVPPAAVAPAQSERPLSMALTTQTEVDRVVQDSHFHDDALCQMLDAAQMELLGEEARRALRRAARQRVHQLKDLHVFGKALPRVVSPTEPRAPEPAVSTAEHVTPPKPDDPPEWAKTLIDRIAMMDDKLQDFERRDSRQIRPSSPPSQDVGEQVTEQLIYGVPRGIPFLHGAPSAPGCKGPPTAILDQQKFASARQEHTVPSTRPHILSWGSEVEMPASESTPPQPLAPVINVLAPTESNDASRAPTHIEANITKESVIPEKKLPATPANVGNPATNSSDSCDPLVPPLPSPVPWEIVTQRLYSWALVWMEKDFVEALANISLGHQVDEFALTVYTMMIFKRNLRHRMTDTPPLPCDKMFVPPNMCDAINRAVHAKRFADAQQLLEELWYPFGFTEPPRIIVALAKHRNDADHWAAHRFDLTNGHLTTYSVFHQEKWLLDGRPFMWWHAIRSTWPQRHIPDPDRLVQRTEKILTAEAHRMDNSLVAANISRNLLLGWRPERMTDLLKLRELVWMELKRLLKRKTRGTLIVNAADDVAEM